MGTYKINNEYLVGMVSAIMSSVCPSYFTLPGVSTPPTNLCVEMKMASLYTNP